MSPVGGTFRSLRNRNYRLFATGQVISLSGTWGQRVAQDWLVLELSGNSGVALGITTGLQFLPVLLFGLYGGVLADRYDKRRLLLGAQAAMGLLALLLAVLDLTGSVQLWHVYALAFGLGLASVVDTPVRQAFVSEMVGPDDLPNAVSLNSATFNSARIVGPAVAGIAIAAVGTGWVFAANALSYVAVLAGLRAMRAADLRPVEKLARAKGQLREGLAYVRARPDLLVPMVLVFMVGTFGLNFQITLALVVKEVFGRGAGSYGLLSACLAVGSLVGALASARRRGPPRQRTLFAAVLVFGLLEVLVGPRAVVRGDGAAAGADRRRGADLHHDGELDHPAGQRARGPRPGDGALHPGLPRRHPRGCAADRRAGRGVRPAQQHPRGRRRHRAVRDRRGRRHDPRPVADRPGAPGAPPPARARPPPRPRRQRGLTPVRRRTGPPWSPPSGC